MTKHSNRRLLSTYRWISQRLSTTHLTEAENAAGEFFDTERLRTCLRYNASLGAAELHKVLLRTLDAFVEGGVIRDDITALVLEYT